MSIHPPHGSDNETNRVPLALLSSLESPTVPGLNDDQRRWIDEVCRQFSDSTGWPIAFQPASQLPSPTPADGAGTAAAAPFSVAAADLAGALCATPPRPGTGDPRWPAVKGLLRLFAEVVNRALHLEGELTERNRTLGRLLQLVRPQQRPDAVAGSLSRCLELAAELSGSDGAAFYLIDPDRPELKLRSAWSAGAMDLPSQRRPLSSGAPDLQAMSRGPLEVRRVDFPQECAWLPAGCHAGVCLPVRSSGRPLGTQPLGTLWVFARRPRVWRRSDMNLLETAGALLAGELERTVLIEESRDRDRLRKELTVASRGQATPDCPDDEAGLPFECAVRRAMREEIGGDLCGVVRLDEHRVAIMVGDATGDSIPAALIRARAEGVLRHLLREPLEASGGTARIVESLNRVLCELLAEDEFFSLFLAIWDEQTRTLTCTNAGHPPPLLIQPQGLRPIKSHGLLPGVLETSRYRASEIPLQPGDLLVLYSDGVSESIARAGRTTLEATVAEQVSQPGVTPGQLVSAIWDEATNDGRLGDDGSLLAIRIP